MTKLTNNYFVCPIDKQLLRTLSRRSDKPALIWFGSYFLLLSLMGAALILTWGTAWAWFFSIVYGALWGCAASGVHETCHKTPFRTRWMNEIVLWTFGWMVQMEPVSVRWGHLGHHSFTHHSVGDTELSEPNPVSWGMLFKIGSGLGGTYFYSKSLLRQAFGYIAEDLREIIPPGKVTKAINNARVMVALYALMVVWALVAATWLPIVLTLGARIIGGPVTGLFHLTQHTCLQMNVNDHRYSTRSFTASPLTRFFYFNMNYHIEHHMFPMVPFYNLPQLSEALKDQFPTPAKGLAGVYREIFSGIIRQRRDPDYFIPKTIPEQAGKNAELSAAT